MYASFQDEDVAQRLSRYYRSRQLFVLLQLDIQTVETVCLLLHACAGTDIFVPMPQDKAQNISDGNIHWYSLQDAE